MNHLSACVKDFTDSKDHFFTVIKFETSLLHVVSSFFGVYVKVKLEIV